MEPSVMSGASTQPASACGDGADAVHLLAPWKQAPLSLDAPPSLETPPSQEAPPSLEAPPSPAKSNSLIPTAARMEDLIDKIRGAHAYLTSARTLSQELKNLQITQQEQRVALEQRIDECLQQACNEHSELIC